MTFSPFNHRGGVGKPAHCKWCGRALRKKWCQVEAPHVKSWHAPDRHYPDGCATGYGPLVKVGEPKLGDYGDGHFCGLRCGYDFGLWFANNGNKLTPTPKK